MPGACKPPVRRRGHNPKTYRSGLEERVALQLRELKVNVQYEAVRLEYVIPEKVHRYTPDWILPNGIVVETKGLWDAADRAKMKLVKAQHPDLDIRLVFQNPNARLTKNSNTTYAQAAEKLGFKWAKGLIPIEWIHETPKPLRGKERKT